jgi:adhesin transport system membrane fusion protein
MTQREGTDQKLTLVLVALLLGIFAWASLAQVDQIVRAEGRIIAAGRAQIVQHLEGGIVEQILVREGQVVAAGDVLMRLSDVQANTTVQQGRSRLSALQAQQARLNAEAQGLPEPQFSGHIPQELQRESMSAFRERLSRFHAERMVIAQQHTQRKAEHQEARQRIVSTQAELDLAKRQSSLMDGLYKKGAASQMENLDAQSRTQKLLSNLSELQGSLPRLESGIAELQARLNESDSRFRVEARNELIQVSAEISKISLAVDGDSDRLKRTEVRAPASGYINRMHFNTMGGVVKPGEALLEITPSEGPVAVEARVRPNDRASLRAGLTTQVRIGAYDYAVYGSLAGRLVEVSADTLADESGQRYYRVLIQTDAPTARMAAVSILPGMTASADVVLGQRSVLTYLLSPLLRFKQRAFSEAT